MSHLSAVVCLTYREGEKGGIWEVYLNRTEYSNQESNGECQYLCVNDNRTSS